MTDNGHTYCISIVVAEHNTVLIPHLVVRLQDHPTLFYLSAIAVYNYEIIECIYNNVFD